MGRTENWTAESENMMGGRANWTGRNSMGGRANWTGRNSMGERANWTGRNSMGGERTGQDGTQWGGERTGQDGTCTGAGTLHIWPQFYSHDFTHPFASDTFSSVLENTSSTRRLVAVLVVPGNFCDNIKCTTENSTDSSGFSWN